MEGVSKDPKITMPKVVKLLSLKDDERMVDVKTYKFGDVTHAR